MNIAFVMNVSKSDNVEIWKITQLWKHCVKEMVKSWLNISYDSMKSLQDHRDGKERSNESIKVMR
jgi:hypothetical protein